MVLPYKTFWLTSEASNDGGVLGVTVIVNGKFYKAFIPSLSDAVTVYVPKYPIEGLIVKVEPVEPERVTKGG